VEASVGAGVEKAMESSPRAPARLEIRLLGPLRVLRHGAPAPLPQSRKVRALLGYLALAGRPVTRSHLCDLLWDSPNDPRGELRWALSKLRGLVDEPGHRRLAAGPGAVSLDVEGATVDVLDLARLAGGGAGEDAVGTLGATLSGGLLEGIELDRCPMFDAWLAEQRRRVERARADAMERLVGTVADAELLRLCEIWVDAAPLDAAAHVHLLGVLARLGRKADAAAHLAAARRMFEGEGLDVAPLDAAWRAVEPPSGRVLGEPAPGPVTAPDPAASSRRARVAMMPFAGPLPGVPTRGGLADALTHDVITGLAKLRTLFVIAQGTVFALDERGVSAEEAARLLDVDYMASGSIRHDTDRLLVAIELVESATSRIVWAEHYGVTPDETLSMLDDIRDRIVAAIAGEIEAAERNRAVLRPPNSLDAWGALHRGLWHMYRFSRDDNETAKRFFERAIELDPTFSRAHAGLSFTHFQDAFQAWRPAENAMDLAYDAAARSLMADDRDPAAHWAMGRALWLLRRRDEAIAELKQTIDLSPNFALGHYTLAFFEAQAGDPEAAVAASDHSRQLSPFDPLMFAMLASRSLGLLRVGRPDEAADWALKAVARPNAHIHITAIAALTLAAADRLDEARTQVARIRRDFPGYRVDNFLGAFRFLPDDERLLRRLAARIGLG
jgi:DNA-binding SARP family transcriptional activator/TolB-like protein/Tfp pilus assembly protein PilF